MCAKATSSDGDQNATNSSRNAAKAGVQRFDSPSLLSATKEKEKGEKEEEEEAAVTRSADAAHAFRPPLPTNRSLPTDTANATSGASASTSAALRMGGRRDACSGANSSGSNCSTSSNSSTSTWCIDTAERSTGAKT